MNTYRIPRYLGLSSALPSENGTFKYSLGYTERLRREIQLDSVGTRFLHACLQPKTKEQLVEETGLSEMEVTDALKILSDSGIVKRITNVEASLQRYDRHLLFFELHNADAVAAQKRISNARIALIGMGGIGSWTSFGLIGAGFKELKLIDFDVIELSNLTRQVLYTEKDIGVIKTEAAAATLRPRNSQTIVTPVDLQVTCAEDLRRHLAEIDFVVVSADRPAKIHDWVDEVCLEFNIPYLNLGYRDGAGVIGPMTLRGATSCYQCFKRDLIENESNPAIAQFESRYQAPSFGPLNAMVSSIGVLEVIKYISGIGPCRSLGVELEIDPMTLEIVEHPYRRDNDCRHCGQPK